ncbi:MAG: purine nucleoside phosphorylase I, inosine and guanosine-specific [Planctomycetota bacterium]
MPTMTGTPTTARKLAKDLAETLLDRTPLRPRIAMLLGTGHASIANQLKDRISFHAEDLPGCLGFASPMLIGNLEGVPVILADSPLSCGESYRENDVTFPIQLLKALGAETLILTAGAASLRRQIESGAIAVVEDHVNLTGIHPRISDDDHGPRFPDMSGAYCRDLIALARETAIRAGIPCAPGILAGISGPSLPTRAEYRFLRMIGADLVGMTLIPEVIAGVHAGLRILALVGVTQQVVEGSEAKTSIEEMLDAADLAAPRMASLLVGIAGSLR